MKTYTIRYQSANGSQNLLMTSERERARKELIRLHKRRSAATVTMAGSLVGRVYREGERWTWYLEGDI